MDKSKAASSYDLFNTEAYYDTYRVPLVTSEDNELEPHGKRLVLSFVLDSLRELFSTGIVSGKRLLDVGTGAYLLSYLSASRHVGEIHLADLLQRHLDLLHAWLGGAELRHDNHLVQYVLLRESSSMSVAERVEEVRSKVKTISFIDVRRAPLLPDSQNQFDIVTSSFCLECAAPSVQDFKQVVANVGTLIKSGGYLVLVGSLEEKFYIVNGFKFLNANICDQDVKSALDSAGFNVVFWREFRQNHSPCFDDLESICNLNGLFVTAAEKTTLVHSQ